VYLLIRKRAVLRYIRRLLAGYVCLAAKHTGILTYFQTKVKKKIRSMMDSGCLILEKSFTAENAECERVAVEFPYFRYLNFASILGSIIDVVRRKVCFLTV